MDDEFEIDPAMAAAMGFSSFGTKRRKHNHDQTVVAEDPSAASTGANNIELGTRNPAAIENTGEVTQEQHGDGGRVMQEQGQPEQMAQEFGTHQEETVPGYTWTTGWPDREELSALRRGIRNDNGDLIVFMPSFVEDPWKGLG